MCFVLPWNTGLWANEIAETLSHHILGGVTNGIFSSDKSMLIQQTSAAAFARLQYSALVEDLATVCCFFELHIIGLLQNMIHMPLVNLLSFESPAQFEFA